MSTVRPATPGAGYPRAVVLLVGLAAAGVVVFGLRQLSGIVGPAFLALVLAIAVQPLSSALARRGIPRWVGSAAALTTVYAALIGFTVALTLAVAQFATLLPAYQDETNRMVDQLVAWLDRRGIGEGQIEQMVEGFDFNRVVGIVGNIVSGLVDVLTGLFFVITLVLFMVIDASRFVDRLRMLPAGHEDWVAALVTFGRATRRYLVVSTVFGLAVAVLDTIALAWMGVPVALLWGLLSFITNYIPNVGFVIGVVPPAVIGLLEGGWQLMVGVLAVYSVLNIVVQTIIQPKIVGDAVGLSTTLTMLSLVFWAFALGSIGALLAVPLTLFTKAVLVDADPRTRWVEPLLIGENPPRPWGGRRERRARRAPAGSRPGAGR